MPSKKLSEFQAKSLWKIFSNNNHIFDYTDNLKLTEFNTKLLENLVVKVDNGSKRRFKRGLVKINKNRKQVIEWIKSRNTHDKYFIETKSNIIKEYYLMIRPENNNDVIYFNNLGGIEQHDPLKNAQKIIIKNNLFELDNDIKKKMDNEIVNIIKQLYNFYRKYHFTFMEVNPLALTDNGIIPLDFAIFMDDCAEFLFDKVEKEIVQMDYFLDNLSKEEKNIRELDLKTGGSLKFKLLNSTGTIWTLIAGGGASVVYTDAIVNRGYIEQLANYGEYSGNPPTELVYQYVTNVFNCMKRVNGDKILFIGGGISNFTDIEKTFTGIIKAMEDNVELMTNTKVYIRRGGPNYKKGLENFKVFSDKYNLNFKINGPEMDITKIVTDALPSKDFERITFDNTDKFKIDIDFNYQNYLKYKFNKNDAYVIYNYQPKAIQRMLDFDYTCNKEKPSIVAVMDPRKNRDYMEKFYWGGEAILIPVINNIERCIKKYQPTHIVSFVSFRSSYQSIYDILDYKCIKTITIIAEGIPENQTRNLNQLAKSKGKLIIGPATVGAIKPEVMRLGNTGGSIENIISSKLYRQGSIAFVTRSGGMLNELCNILSQKTDGVYMGLSIGGDRYPGSNFYDHIMNYNNDDNVSMIIMLGEIGGIQELIIANAVIDGLITKPIIGYCMGTSSCYFAKQGNDNIQFGHAGASANEDYETANFKNFYMNKAGITVPKSFEELSDVIENKYKTLNKNKTVNNKLPQIIPKIKKNVEFFSSISNEMGDELKYNNILISDIVKKGVGNAMGHLWFKKQFPSEICKYFELILSVVADHGGMVSGAHNTIVSSRAGKDLVSSLCSGLLTIGDYFGGAINEAGRLFFYASENEKPKDFILRMKKNNKLISGIGHKIKTKKNPDKRITVLLNFMNKHIKKHKVIDYAFKVEEITLQKRNNLILNVDGFIACSLIDCFRYVGMDDNEIKEILDNGLMNGFFVLGRTIGFIGHWYDQKRLKQGLYRVNKNSIKYIK